MRINLGLTLLWSLVIATNQQLLQEVPQTRTELSSIDDVHKSLQEQQARTEKQFDHTITTLNNIIWTFTDQAKKSDSSLIKQQQTIDQKLNGIETELKQIRQLLDNVVNQSRNDHGIDNGTLSAWIATSASQVRSWSADGYEVANKKLGSWYETGASELGVYTNHSLLVANQVWQQGTQLGAESQEQLANKLTDMGVPQKYSSLSALSLLVIGSVASGVLGLWLLSKILSLFCRSLCCRSSTKKRTKGKSRNTHKVVHLTK